MLHSDRRSKAIRCSDLPKPAALDASIVQRLNTETHRLVIQSPLGTPERIMVVILVGAICQCGLSAFDRPMPLPQDKSQPFLAARVYPASRTR